MLDMMSEETFSQIGSWMNDCRKNHTTCLNAEQTPLPTRLVDVTPIDGSEIVRIHTTYGEKERYAALSYCWGGPQPIALTKATMAQMEKMIQLSSLPQTLQDAIIVTSKLCLRYIWVDAMCIIQDSQEDKKKELKSMAQTYQNAFITISAASPRSSQDGFLQTRRPRESKFPRFVLPYRAWDSDNQSMTETGTVVLQEQFFHDPMTEPINR